MALASGIPTNNMLLPFDCVLKVPQTDVNPAFNNSINKAVANNPYAGDIKVLQNNLNSLEKEKADALKNTSGLPSYVVSSQVASLQSQIDGTKLQINMFQSLGDRQQMYNAQQAQIQQLQAQKASFT
jgi:hypothetical protein